MRSEQLGVRWSIPVLALWLTLCVACGSEPAQPTAEAERSSTPGTTPASIDAEDARAPVTPTLSPTILPPPTPTASVLRPQRKARRSDFIVPRASPTARSVPLAITQALTPTISATSLPTATRTPLKDAPTCTYDAEFIADVTVSDDTILDPGGTFTKTWRVRNTGSCDWDAGFHLAFAGGDDLDGPLTVTVSPTLVNQIVDVSVPLTAPQRAGTHSSHWELRTATGQTFGSPIFVRIIVGTPSTPEPGTQLPPRSDVTGVAPLVLLNYFAWYDETGWDGCNISAGDGPMQLYHSDDPAAIRRHVQMALDAGADGFTQQWFAPGDRTDRNFGTLLSQSQGTDFRSTVVFLRHIWHGTPAPSQANVVDAVRYILKQYGEHPNFLKLDRRPVLFFTDVYRVPLGAGQTSQQAWASIRAQADPGGNAWWIAEGLDPSYLAVFDGLWVYKITHAAYPQAYLKASQWAEGVRRWEAQTSQRKLWIATASPGWDDTRASCRADVRVPSAAHKQERAEGVFYRATFAAALASQPDWLWINSFNEWVEGTYIEPSTLYGDLYLQITRELAARFHAR